MRALRGGWHRSRRRAWRRCRCRRRASIASGLEADAGQLGGLIRVLTGAAVVEADAGERGLDLSEGVITFLRRARAIASGGRAGIGLVDGELGLEIRDQVCAVSPDGIDPDICPHAEAGEAEHAGVIKRAKLSTGPAIGGEDFQPLRGSDGGAADGVDGLITVMEEGIQSGERGAGGGGTSGAVALREGGGIVRGF